MGDAAKANAAGRPATRRKRRKVAAPLILIGVFLFWEAATRALGIPEYLLPAPTRIFSTLWLERISLFDHATATLWQSLAGFALGNLVAITLAIAFVENETVKDTVYPMAVAVRTVPIIAIVPILTLLLGTGWHPKVAIAALIVFFPTLVDMMKGLTSVSREVHEFCHVINASRWYVLWRMRFPASLPFLFASLRIAATSCVLGAVVAEWLGSTKGLGYIIVMSTYQYRGDLLFAGIFLASGIAMLLFWLVGVAESRVMRWEQRPELGAEG